MIPFDTLGKALMLSMGDENTDVADVRRASIRTIRLRSLDHKLLRIPHRARRAHTQRCIGVASRSHAAHPRPAHARRLARERGVVDRPLRIARRDVSMYAATPHGQFHHGMLTTKCVTTRWPISGHEFFTATTQEITTDLDAHGPGVSTASDRRSDGASLHGLAHQQRKRRTAKTKSHNDLHAVAAAAAAGDGAEAAAAPAPAAEGDDGKTLGSQLSGMFSSMLSA